MSHRIEEEVVGQVAVVTFDRPPHNFASVGLIGDLADRLEEIDGRPDIRAVVLRSQGGAFCAGADLNSGEDSLAQGMDGIGALYGQAIRLFATRKPIVAAVQGPAVGAGLGLALAADFRVAAPEARFVANFTKLAFHPGFGLTVTLPRLIGEQRAALMFLTSRRIKGEEALAWGLADDIAPLADLRGRALALAQECAENGPLAVAATRATLRRGLVEKIRQQMDHEHREQTALRGTADFAEGVRSVAERRPGRFVGA